MPRTGASAVSGPTAALFGLFVGAFAAALLAVAASWAGFPLTPARGAAYAGVGLALAWVAAKGLRLV